MACTLDLLGDKWTLLVVRDLLLGKTIYSEFRQSPERIPTNILAERLKRLQAAGLVVKDRYQDHPPRYRYLLTGKGRDLYPVLSAIIDWGNRHIPGTLDSQTDRGAAAPDTARLRAGPCGNPAPRSSVTFFLKASLNAAVLPSVFTGCHAEFAVSLSGLTAGERATDNVRCKSAKQGV